MMLELPANAGITFKSTLTQILEYSYCNNTITTRWSRVSRVSVPASHSGYTRQHFYYLNLHFIVSCLFLRVIVIYWKLSTETVCRKIIKFKIMMSHTYSFLQQFCIKILLRIISIKYELEIILTFIDIYLKYLLWLIILLLN